VTKEKFKKEVNLILANNLLKEQCQRTLIEEKRDFRNRVISAARERGSELAEGRFPKKKEKDS